MVLLCVPCAAFAIFAVTGLKGSERPGFVEVVSPKWSDRRFLDLPTTEDLRPTTEFSAFPKSRKLL